MSFIVAGAIGGGVTGLGIGKGAALGFGANLISKMFGGKDDAFKGGDPSAPAGDGSALGNNAGSLRDSFSYNPWSQSWSNKGGETFTGQQSADSNKDGVGDLGMTTQPSQPSGAFGSRPAYQNPFFNSYNPFLGGMGATLAMNRNSMTGVPSQGTPFAPAMIGAAGFLPALSMGRIFF